MKWFAVHYKVVHDCVTDLILSATCCINLIKGLRHYDITYEMVIRNFYIAGAVVTVCEMVEKH